MLKAVIHANRILQCVLDNARPDDILENSFQGHTEVKKVIECKTIYFRYMLVYSSFYGHFLCCKFKKISANDQ